MNKVDVARFLLEEGFYLTALEFYQELKEGGEELSILKKEFGYKVEPLPWNQKNLRSDEGKMMNWIPIILRKKTNNRGTT